MFELNSPTGLHCGHLLARCRRIGQIDTRLETSRRR